MPALFLQTACKQCSLSCLSSATHVCTANFCASWAAEMALLSFYESSHEAKVACSVANAQQQCSSQELLSLMCGCMLCRVTEGFGGQGRL